MRVVARAGIVPMTRGKESYVRSQYFEQYVS